MQGNFTIFKRRVLLLLSAVLISNMALAQNVELRGQVLSEVDNTPIIGAIIVVEGTSIGASTDLDGNFILKNAPQSGNIVVEYLGFQPTTLPIQPNKNYKILLSEDSTQIDEVLVVGYGTMRKKEVTGAVVRVDTDAISRVSTSDIGSALQGQVAGVNVQFSDGAPGSVANIQIRGISSINGSSAPLYVVDGVPYDGDPGLSANEIESIDILKDAASAAIYGTRGAGGVILVTTKKGSEGAAKVTIDANYGIQNITSRLYTMDAAQTIAVQTLKNMRGETETPNSTNHPIKNNITNFMNNSDMLSVIEQNNQPITNIAVNVSGGNKGSTYNIMGNYFSQDGIIVNSSFERINLRANTSFKIKKITLSANISSQVSDKQTADSGLYGEVYRYDPLKADFDPNAGNNVSNSDDINDNVKLGMTMQRFQEQNTANVRSLNTNFSLKYDIAKNLNFLSRLSNGYTTTLEEILNPRYTLYDSYGVEVSDSRFRSGIRNTTINNTSFTWENTLNYALKINKHDIKLTAVGGVEKRNQNSYYAERKDLISNDLPNVGAATGDVAVGRDSYNRESTLIGMLARLQYDYDDKYMLSASIRRDGSSRFAEDNRWGVFPSISGGWNISEEEFWSPIKDVVNSFKLRASYGTTGNQNFSDYTYYTTISGEQDYGFGSSAGEVTINQGYSQAGYSNSEVMWETTKQANLGLDLALLRSKLTITADIYESNKSDMLFPVTIPPVNGTGLNDSVVLNVGNMENKGFEFAASWRDNINDFNYFATFTLSRNVNTITKMSGSNDRVPLGQISTIGSSSQYVTFLQEGYEAGAFMLLPTAGVINTYEKLIEYQEIKPSAQMGDLIYVDADGDGYITDNDRQYYGSGAPEFELGCNLGFNWKSFDFSTSLYASIGNEVIDGSKISSYKNMRHLDLMNMWNPYNPQSTIPIYVDGSHDNVNSASDYWITDGSFFRIKNIMVGYTFSDKAISKIGLTKLRVYVAADNIWTLTKYAGYNPGVGNDGLKTRGLDNGTYPLASQVRGGVQINF